MFLFCSRAYCCCACCRSSTFGAGSSTVLAQTTTHDVSDSEGTGCGLYKLPVYRGPAHCARDYINDALELKVQQVLAIQPWTVMRGVQGSIEFVNTITKEILPNSPFLRRVNVSRMGCFSPHELQSKFGAMLHMEQPAAVSITYPCANLDDGEARAFLHGEITRRMVEQRRILRDDSTSAQWCALCAIMLSILELLSAEVAAECCALLPAHIL